jgi:hypothetical protein
MEIVFLADKFKILLENQILNSEMLPQIFRKSQRTTNLNCIPMTQIRVISYVYYCLLRRRAFNRIAPILIPFASPSPSDNNWTWQRPISQSTGCLLLKVHDCDRFSIGCGKNAIGAKHMFISPYLGRSNRCIFLRILIHPLPFEIVKSVIGVSQNSIIRP